MRLQCGRTAHIRVQQVALERPPAQGQPQSSYQDGGSSNRSLSEEDKVAKRRAANRDAARRMRQKRAELLRSLQQQHGVVNEEVRLLRNHLDGATQRHKDTVEEVQSLKQQVQALKANLGQLATLAVQQQQLQQQVHQQQQEEEAAHVRPQQLDQDEDAQGSVQILHRSQQRQQIQRAAAAAATKPLFQPIIQRTRSGPVPAVAQEPSLAHAPEPLQRRASWGGVPAAAPLPAAVPQPTVAAAAPRPPPLQMQAAAPLQPRAAAAAPPPPPPLVHAAIPSSPASRQAAALEYLTRCASEPCLPGTTTTASSFLTGRSKDGGAPVDAPARTSSRLSIGAPRAPPLPLAHSAAGPPPLPLPLARSAQHIASSTPLLLPFGTLGRAASMPAVAGATGLLGAATAALPLQHHEQQLQHHDQQQQQRDLFAAASSAMQVQIDNPWSTPLAPTPAMTSPGSPSVDDLVLSLGLLEELGGSSSGTATAAAGTAAPAAGGVAAVGGGGVAPMLSPSETQGHGQQQQQGMPCCQDQRQQQVHDQRQQQQRLFNGSGGGAFCGGATAPCLGLGPVPRTPPLQQHCAAAPFPHARGTSDATRLVASPSVTITAAQALAEATATANESPGGRVNDDDGDGDDDALCQWWAAPMAGLQGLGGGGGMRSEWMLPPPTAALAAAMGCPVNGPGPVGADDPATYLVDPDLPLTIPGPWGRALP